MPTLYVFVDIAIDIDHLIGSVELTFPAGTQLVGVALVHSAACCL